MAWSQLVKLVVGWDKTLRKQRHGPLFEHVQYVGPERFSAKGFHELVPKKVLNDAQSGFGRLNHCTQDVCYDWSLKGF